MIALDTNVVVRVLAKDDPDQLAVAVQVMAEPELFLSKSVLLETAWVLAFTYGLDRGHVGKALAALVGYANITVEDRAAVLRALEWHSGGMDIADALHLASARSATELATFDRKLSTAAKRVAATPPVRLLPRPRRASRRGSAGPRARR